MADDSMEIVLDSGNSQGFSRTHNDGDDLLEIDIDLLHGYPDEDDMLEDAPQVTSLDENAKPTTHRNTDEYMLDDEQQDVMYDTNDELMYEEDGTEHEEPSHSYVNVEDPAFPTFVESTTPQRQNQHMGSQAYDEDAPGVMTAASVSLDTTRMGSPLPLKNELNIAEDLGEIADIQHGDNPEVSLLDNPDKPNIDTGSHHNAESEQFQNANLEEEEISYDDYVESVEAMLQPIDNANDPTPRSIRDPIGLAQIKVMYQSGEYHLFDNGSGDPDQYFLDDILLGVAPIRAVFSAIRDVLGAEVGDDEELCISFREFGIEVEETTCSERNLDIAAVLSMHKRFIENENPEDLDAAYADRPLRIFLATRPLFHERVIKLLQGAHERRTLAETLAPYDIEDSADDEIEESEGQNLEQEILFGEEEEEQRSQIEEGRDSASLIANGKVATDNDEDSEEDLDNRKYDKDVLDSRDDVEEAQVYEDAGEDEAVIGNILDKNHDGNEELTKASREHAQEGQEASIARSLGSDAAEAQNEVETEETRDAKGVISGTITAQYSEANVEDSEVKNLVDQSSQYTHSEDQSKDPDVQQRIDEFEDWQEDFQEMVHNPIVSARLNDYDHDAQGNDDENNSAESDSSYVDTAGSVVEAKGASLADTSVPTAGEAEVSHNDGVDVIENDDIDFGLDDEKAENSEHGLVDVPEDDDIPIAWSSAAILKPDVKKNDPEHVDNTASSTTLSATGEEHHEVAEDEITYDDDDLEPDLRTPLKTEAPTFPSKDSSAKRSWEDTKHNDDLAKETNGDAKRIRA